ncbi:MAG: ABC transporter permease [Acidobacteria bacterium]|nr:ABC transporter permease [Acidobacteriota bacterium]
MDALFNDLRYAARNLRNARGFTTVALVTLALGIGATTAMFSVVNGVLLRPLPYAEPDRLVAINEFNSDHPAPEVPQGQLSFPDYQDVASRSHSFASVAAYTFTEFTVTGIGKAAHLKGELVTSGIFRVLGVQPAMGRAFLPSEDGPGYHVAIISDRLWREYFHADRGVLGRPLALDGRSFTIVGVMPAGFQFAPRSAPGDLWTTFSRWAEMNGGNGPTAQRGNHSLFGIARLRPGITLEQANADLSSIYRALASEYPDKNRHSGIAATPELRYAVGQTREPLLVLMSAVGLVLLIACVNVANLLLARGAGRTQEIAVRAALGATRGRLIRQLITESIVLALLGTALGTGLATWAVAAVLKLYPENLPRASEIAIDGRVLLFTASLALAAGILFGLVPAWRISVPNLAETMRSRGRTFTAGPAHQRVRSALVVAETALGVMLLVGAGLLIRSFERLSHVDLGFNPEHLVTASFDISSSRYQPEQMDRFIREFVARAGAVPGVMSAAGSLPLPLGGNDLWSVGINLLDHPVPESDYPSAGFYLVTNGFFQTMQMPLLRGRFFDDRDQRDSAPVMIVTQEFARRFYPSQDPIGHKVYMGAGEGGDRKKYETREIVGVVRDIRTTNLAKPPAPAFCVPISQMLWGTPTLVIRTQTAAATLGPELAKLLATLDPEAPLYDVRSMDDWLAFDLGRARFQATLLGIFAGLAMLMTAVGLYGVISSTVAQRTHEIGIRVALGASRLAVIRMLLKQGAELTLLGTAAGVAAALAFARLLGSLLYGVHPHDPGTYIAVCIALGAVAVLASYIPARRGTRVDPVVALRAE